MTKQLDRLKAILRAIDNAYLVVNEQELHTVLNCDHYMRLEVGEIRKTLCDCLAKTTELIRMEARFPQRKEG